MKHNISNNVSTDLQSHSVINLSRIGRRLGLIILTRSLREHVKLISLHNLLPICLSIEFNFGRYLPILLSI